MKYIGILNRFWSRPPLQCPFWMLKNLNFNQGTGISSIQPISTGRWMYIDKKTSDDTTTTTAGTSSPDNFNNFDRDTKDQDGYSFDQLDSKEQKVILDQFKTYMEKNAYYEKYKSRIVAAQKASPKGFLAMVENVIPTKKKQSSTLERLRACNSTRKPLGEIMKIDMLMELPRNEIIFIWKEYHKSIKSIGAAMSGTAYDQTENNGKTYNTFVLPLPKNMGYEFFLVQYGAQSFHFTQLIKYHKYKENSPVCLTLNFYKDLKNTKDLVLMRGEIDGEILVLEEAQFLAVQLNYYYSEVNKRRESILKQFNKSPMAFDHNVVIEELQKLTIEYKDTFPQLNDQMARQL